MQRPAVAKSATGIEGFDEITHGGLPTGRATLVTGGPGSGKTVLALQSLVHGARELGEPGIFVSFEESSDRILANAAGFGWDLPKLARRRLFFLDARPSPDLVQSGEFDLLGLLAGLEAKARSMDARRIVFDSIEQVLSLLGSERAARRELLRLHEWLLGTKLTAVLTAKSHSRAATGAASQLADEMQFMVDCVVTLEHGVDQAVSHRSLRVLKLRGSAFSENETPFAIGERGLEVAGGESGAALASRETASNERVSSGIERLDTMLGGGYFRGAGVLITGAPGTAKTTLCGAFCRAALERGEPTLYVSFDSQPAEIVRNLASVGIRLAKYSRNGSLRLIAPQTTDGSAELHFLRLRQSAREHGSRCLVVDPVSALAKRGNRATGHEVVERLTRWAKGAGITMVCTSLIDDPTGAAESTQIEISTLADTWIHLTYAMSSGERNRALTIVKSRGTAHSNQVRELLLTDSGVTLADVYAAGGEVLMGTLRWEREQAERDAEQLRGDESRRRMAELALVESELEARARAIELELAVRRTERERLQAVESRRIDRGRARQTEVRNRRRADKAPRRPGSKG